MSDFDLTGRTVVVTGASAGIGAATCAALEALGARVLAVDLSEPSSPPVVGRTYISADVADEDSVRAMGDAVAAVTNELAGLVNVVGTNYRRPLQDLTLTDWQRIIDVDLTSMFLVTRALLKLLQAGRGAIVNVASSCAKGGLPNRAPYSAAKSGVIGLSRALAVEFANHEIRVNSVSPGPIESPRRARDIADGQFAAAAPAATVLFRREGQAREVGNAIAFLISPAASFITGIDLSVDGGQTAHLGAYEPF
jgi:NAD(P)-dependent dehydrogenase (short-subunit alcohol dehydrogenase family)